MNPNDWAALGVPVFPCLNAPGTDKHNSPLVEGGVKSATTNSAQIEAWWKKFPNASPGLRCGEVFDVIDLDIDKETGETVGEDYLREHYPEAWGHASVIVKTPSGGRHLFYKPGAELKNYVKALPGIDVRTTNGYVVGVGAPGYEFLRGGPAEFDSLYAPPESIIGALNAKRRDREAQFDSKPTAKPVEITPERERYAERALVRECEDVRTMESGGRNARLNTAAFNLGTLVGAGALDEARVIDELTTAAIDAGLAKDETRKTIHSGLASGKTKPRDLSSIKDAATVDDFVERFVYVENRDTVADLHRVQEISGIPLRNFQNTHAMHHHEVPCPTAKDPDRTKSVPVANSWLASPDRKTAFDYAYEPGRERHFTQNGVAFLNTYQPPVWGDGGNGLADFQRLLALLAPDEKDRELLAQWVAYTVHRPAERSPITPLIITPAQGVGKGLFGRIIEKMVGRSNTKRPKMPEVMNENYKGYLLNSVFVAVDEVREGITSRNRYTIMSDIRDILTEPRLSVSEKYVAATTRPVFANFMMFSNHVDALILQNDDRRIAVFISDEQPDSEVAFYDRLAAMADGHVPLGDIAEWLRPQAEERLPSHAPMNASKRRMIEDSQEDWVQELPDLLAGVDSIRKDELSGKLFATGASPHAISKEVQRLGYKTARHRINNIRVLHWDKVGTKSRDNVVEIGSP